MSIAINIRPNLLVFVPFFFLLSKEPIKYIFSLGVFCGALFSISISICNYIYHDYTLLNFLEGLKIYEKIYVTGDVGWGFNTSLFNVIKFLSKFFGISFRASLVNIIVSALMLMMISYAIYIFKKKRMYPFEFLYILASITMLGTPVFADYHLLIFISPIFFLVSTHGASFRFELSKDSLVPLIFIISCLMLSPLNYYEFQGFYVASAIKTVVAFLSCLFIFKVAGQRKDDLVV